MKWNARFFTFKEMTASATARRYGIGNLPDQAQRDALLYLCQEVLDPLRDAWGEPIIVTSGFRSPRLNALVGGASNSQHMLGQAADIRTLSDRPEDNQRLFALILQIRLPFDQLIDEYAYDWIHVSHQPSGRQRRQVMHVRRMNGHTVYTHDTQVTF